VQHLTLENRGRRDRREEGKLFTVIVAWGGGLAGVLITNEALAGERSSLRKKGSDMEEAGEIGRHDKLGGRHPDVHPGKLGLS